MEQKKVKIISLTATNFGVFKALELDFEKFKTGLIAIKGNAGAGKTTTQNALKTGVQGRASLADAGQYGDEWETETQLIDGDHQVFIGAKKKSKNDTITYSLFEKDTEGKKVMTPVIDGLKATPSKYMDLISTELTFGIKDFLSPDKTTHRKFMFQLFRPELEKFGVIFDKKDPEYDNSILGELDQLTETRDNLRAQCQHQGAFVADFQREGHTVEDFALLKRQDVQELTAKHTDTLVEKGKLEGTASADVEKKKTEVSDKGRQVIEKVRTLKDKLSKEYDEAKEAYDSYIGRKNMDNDDLETIATKLLALSFVDGTEMLAIADKLRAQFDEAYKDAPEEPIIPISPTIENNALKVTDGVVYHSAFKPLIEEHRDCVSEYMGVTMKPINYTAIDEKIASLASQIDKAKEHNGLIDRYELNREWVEADAVLNEKRQELAKMYAKVNTGVSGLKMKPFFNEEKMEIKTVYNGEYDTDFFKPGKDESDQLLLSYSSTQRPIIGILLQVARLKIKSKMLPYIFIDDVPMDNRSKAIIARIAEENGLTIITSITGDFEKNKLTENEILIEGGEVFFSE